MQRPMAHNSAPNDNLLWSGAAIQQPQQFVLTGSSNPAQWIRVKLAQNKEQLRQYRQTLREKLENSTLCNGKEFAREIENAYRMMWRKWCKENN